MVIELFVLPHILNVVLNSIKSGSILLQPHCLYPKKTNKQKRQLKSVQEL